MKRYRLKIPLIMASLLAIGSFFLPVIITGIFGLFFTIFSAVKWGLYGGLFSSIWAVMILMTLFFREGLALIDFVAAVSGYLILGISLGKTIDYFQRQRRRLDSILQGTQVGSWEWNVKTGEMLVNERWAKNIGYDYKELAPISKKTWDDLTHPEDLEKRAHLLERHFQGDLHYYTMECRLKHKEGYWVWVLEQGQVLQWMEDNTPLWMFGTYIDITASKKVEEELQKKERRLSLAQTFAQAGTWEYTFESKSLYWSKECEALFGLREGEFEGTFDDFLKRVHPLDQDHVREVNRPIIERGEGLHLNYVHRIVKKGGEVCWVREFSGVYEDEGGQPISIIGLVLDITQLKEAENALQESEENLRTALDSIGDGVIVTDTRGSVVQMNPVAERLTGYSMSREERPLLHNVFSIFHIETRESLVDPFFEVVQQGETVSMDKFVLLISKDKREFQINLLASPILNERGEGMGVVIVFRDSTEEQMMQRKLEESEHRFQKMLALIPDMVSIHDKEMNILYSNWNGFGNVPEEKRILHTKCYATYRGLDSICPDCKARTVFERKEPFQKEYHLPDGRWIDLRVLPILDENHELEMFVEWVRDITDLKKTESELEEKEEQYRLLSEFASDMVWITDTDLVYTYISPSVERVLGYTVEECLGMAMDKTLMPSSEKRARALFEEELAEEQERDEKRRPIELEHRSRDGLSVWVEVRVKAIRDERGSPIAILGVARDITDRREAEDSLKESEQRLNMLISNTPAVIYSFVVEDDKAQFTYINDNVKFVLGFEPEELMYNHRLYKESLHPDDSQELEDRMAFLLEKGRDTIEYRFKDSHGQYHWLCDEQKMIVHDDGTYEVVGIWWDITDRKEAEKRLLEQTKRAEEIYQKLEKELDKARQVHEHLLPEKLPVVEGISFATHYQPAEKIGGDFYEVVRVRNKLIIYLSDVSGHGLDSAMLSLFVKHTIYGFLSFSPTDAIAPAHILQYLVRQFQQENYPEHYFICIFLCVLDLETMELTYTGMGFQDSPLVQSGNGHRSMLMTRGLFITSYFPLDVMNFNEGHQTLTPGTTIFFNTDGISEEGEPGMFYRNRLSQVFYEHAHESPQVIVDRVVEDFRVFNHGSIQGEDDITLLVIQVEPVKKEEYHLELTTDFGELKRLREELMVLFGEREESYNLMTGVSEMVANAIEHGNLLDPMKRVWVDISIMEESIVVSIEDEGDGFDWREKIYRPFDLMGHTDRGRGIAMTKIFCDNISYNEQGNQVVLTVKTRKGE